MRDPHQRWEEEGFVHIRPKSGAHVLLYLFIQIFYTCFFFFFYFFFLLHMYISTCPVAVAVYDGGLPFVLRHFPVRISLVP